jgi:hypothetical protein
MQQQNGGLRGNKFVSKGGGDELSLIRSKIRVDHGYDCPASLSS